MKTVKLLMLAFCMAFTMNLRAQIPVTDVATAGFSYANMLQTLETMWTSYDQLEEVREGVRKLQSVNNKVKQAKLVLAITDNVRDVSKILLTLPENIAKIENPEIKNITQEVINTRIQELSVFKDLFTSSMTSNFFEGGDFERLTFLTEIYRESVKLRASMAKLNRIVQKATF